MPGTKVGGDKAATTNKNKYGKDFYKVIGQKGGKAPTEKLKGFAANRELASQAGRKGGTISRRYNKPLPSEKVKRRHFLWIAK